MFGIFINTPFKVPRVYLFHHQGEPDAKIIQNSELFAKFAENPRFLWESITITSYQNGSLK